MLYPKIAAYALSLAVLFLGSQCTKKDSDAEKIKQETAAFKLALFSHDIPKLTSLLAPDATCCNLAHRETLSGNQNVASLLSASLGTTLLPDTHVHVEKITSKGRDAKSVKGLLDLHQSDCPPKQVAFALDFKKDGLWRIQQVSYLLLEPAPSHYEQLKDLNWLAGSWVNESENTTFSTTYTWDLNKNFLVQHFSLKILGHNQLDGQQQIGWDAHNNSICSWCFDSHGGIAKGTWVQSGNIWHVTTSSILPDGSRASATHVFTKVSNNKCTFSSTNRTVNDQPQPDIGPFTAIKVGAS